MKLQFVAGMLVITAISLAPAAAAAQAAERQGPDTVEFTTARGNVTFTHGRHREAGECVSCHHESRPEKPLSAPRERCRTCHTSPPTAPMHTSAKAAMHDTAERTGTCFNCHVKAVAEGKAAPVKCAECHKSDS